MLLCGCVKTNSKENELENIDINYAITEYGISKIISANKGIVPDEETAIKIAEAVFLPIYGDTINENKPFKASYYSEYGVWLVEGIVKQPLFGTKIGGVPYIIIQKNDGKIIAIWHDR